MSFNCETNDIWTHYLSIVFVLFYFVNKIWIKSSVKILLHNNFLYKFHS